MPEPVDFNCGIIFDREIKLEESAILHYTYPKFSDLTSRRDRCGCKPTKVDVKRCFMLEFDRAVSGGLIPFFLVYCCEAYKSQSSFLCRHLSLLQPQAQRKCFNGISIFIVPSLDSSFRWCILTSYTIYRYREHVVWTDDTLKLKLLRKGILTRIYAPMVRSNHKPQTLFLMLGFPQAAFIFFFFVTGYNPRVKRGRCVQLGGNLSSHVSEQLFNRKHKPRIISGYW